MKLSAEDKALLTPTEIQALEGEGADTHLAQLGEGEGEGTDASLSSEDSDEAAAAAAAAGAGGAAEGEQGDDEGDEEDEAALTPEQLAAAAAELQPAAAPAAPKLPVYDVSQRDFKAERTAVETEKADVLKKYAAGELSDEEFFAETAKVDAKALALATAEATEATIARINADNAKAEQQKVIDSENAAMQSLAIEAKKAGTIDYGTDTVAQGQFDAAFNAVKLDPKNAGAKPSDLVKKAHTAVLAMRGIAAPAPAAAPAAAAAAAPTPPAPRQVPPGIGGLPNASQAQLNDDAWETYSRLSGPAADDWLAQQPAAVQSRILRIADNSGLTH